MGPTIANSRRNTSSESPATNFLFRSAKYRVSLRWRFWGVTLGATTAPRDDGLLLRLDGGHPYDP